MRWTAVITGVLLGLHGVALAQDPLQNKSIGPVVLLPPTAGAVGEDPPDAGTLHLPGREYRAGSGWWALACDGACTLAPLQLEVAPRPFPAREDNLVSGQALRFSPAPPAGTLLLFKPWRAPASALRWRPGVVDTLHPGPASRLRARADTPGTQEAEVPLPDGRVLGLRPVLHTLSRVASEEHDGLLMLEVTLDGRRQTLGRFAITECEPPPLRRATFLRWAGDLDHDGRPDLLVDFSLGHGQNLALFLSSLAGPGQVVGEAGRFRLEPVDVVGC